jgi:urease accessory protein
LIVLSSKKDPATGDISVASERVSKLFRLAPVEKPGPDRVAGLARAEAQLQFAVDAEGRTYLARHCAAYPHHLTRTFRLDRAAPQAATVYLQSLSGGLLQGDHVALRLAAGGGAIAHVTTQAATKVHSMDRGFARQEVNIEALDESHLEYIADPTICFPRSRLFSQTELCVAAGASAIVAESYLWHDPHGGGEMVVDALAMETAIRRPDGHLMALDRSSLTSARGLSGNPALLGPHRALGTLFAVGRGCGREGALSVVRGALEAIPGVYAGVSRLPAEAGLWARVLASDGASLRAAMESAWRRCHEQMLGWVSDRRRK